MAFHFDWASLAEFPLGLGFLSWPFFFGLLKAYNPEFLIECLSILFDFLECANKYVEWDVIVVIPNYRLIDRNTRRRL